MESPDGAEGRLEQDGRARPQGILRGAHRIFPDGANEQPAGEPAPRLHAYCGALFEQPPFGGGGLGRQLRPVPRQPCAFVTLEAVEIVAFGIH